MFLHMRRDCRENIVLLPQTKSVTKLMSKIENGRGQSFARRAGLRVARWITDAGVGFSVFICVPMKYYLTITIILIKMWFLFLSLWPGIISGYFSYWNNYIQITTWIGTHINGGGMQCIHYVLVVMISDIALKAFLQITWRKKGHVGEPFSLQLYSYYTSAQHACNVYCIVITNT